MAQPILMPKLGQTLTEGTIVTWRKHVGDTIKRGDILFDVETDKAVNEAESFHDGTLLKIIVQEGETVAVLEPVAYVGEVGEAVPDDVASSAEPTAADAQTLSSVKSESAAISAGSRSEPLSGMRKTIAKRLTESFTTTPHFYLTVSADMTDLLAYRNILKEEGNAYTVTDFILWAVVLALQEFPDVNSVTDGRTVTRHRHVNLGIAVGMDDGLMVPVVRNAEDLDLRGLHDATADVVTQARDGKLHPDETVGSTFTVSNMGMLNVENFTAIINPGEAAILAISSTEDKVMARNGEMQIRAMMKMTLSSDHRIVDGTLAAKFMNAVKNKLENMG